MSNSLPKSLKQVSFFLERLPGIGEKSANRLAFYLLRMPDEDLKDFSEQVAKLKAQTKRCKICMNLTEEELCGVCDDSARDGTRITVVEDVLDLLSLETGDIYDGMYHVLHGRIDPLNHIGPDDIFLEELFTRLKPKTNGHVTPSIVKEVILATNPDMEGEATAMYLRNRLQELKKEHSLEFTITRLGYGMPMGGNLEYADYMTLRKALENRRGF
ncbi:MAG: recombination mediator RecR [Candidatus Roizmanbacteria bacterium]|uniref:Recombination protein RecR n=2 Tax=Candidatus Roizmaniibacteriota TaxID=1752723 RepID=A0A2M8F020_9BACT|nr:recombination mediator RecR [Candidatus Roizmanbacteria bacterium]PIZ66056.1 MAG: recombination protein RecR [Candidatus Roizmanbacteria bacterium CG_4_10_14_0_2_um_filter_39_12]PJC32642.1 MAG: recombination protein RecR [Candidatus Roizmanbacteria bacterium CG_4_9_14_0_2_um_filter_39_13]PJE61699.1 MAG: recombination protein RecR [Candidatus Roizmanbacteria bacterium CG10_big_fil_rev_8_21_14_0_10_39_12]